MIILVAKWKSEAVKELKDLILKYDIVAVVDLNNLPARQLQVLKEKLRNDVYLKVARKRLIKIALDELESERKGISGLNDSLKTIPALLLTNYNPFKLYKILDNNKSPAPLKAGQEAPKDVWIKAGPTGFLPGPIIGELGAAGLKTVIEGGKVGIKEDKKVLSEGDLANQEMASLLMRLNVLPGEVGLNLTGVYEDGMVFEPKVLRIDETEYANKINLAIMQAVNLSVNSMYLTKDTAKLGISNAASKALNVAVETNYICKETTDMIFGKVNSQVRAIASILPDEALSDELKSVKNSASVVVSSAIPAEDKKTEVAKEEVKEEASEEDTMSAFGSLF